MVRNRRLSELSSKRHLYIITVVVIGCVFLISAGYNRGSNALQADLDSAVREQSNGVLLGNAVDNVVLLCKNASTKLGEPLMTKNGVKQIQRWLYTSGYLQAGEDDGILGRKTSAALSAYQNDHGLKATGSATLETQFMLSLSGSVYEQNAIGDYYTGSMDYCISVYVDDDQTTTFFGEATSGQPNGQGVCIFFNGDIFIGCFSDGKRSGDGVMYFSDGDKYSGNWVKDKMEGYGVYSFDVSEHEKYAGNWESNMMNGEGTYTFPDGSKVSGVWIKNHLQGGVS